MKNFTSSFMKLLVWVAKVASLAVISQKGSDKY